MAKQLYIRYVLHGLTPSRLECAQVMNTNSGQALGLWVDDDTYCCYCDSLIELLHS